MPCSLVFGGVLLPFSKKRLTWRIIPFSKWLVTPIYTAFSPFGRGPITLHRELTITMVINHLLHPGMILQVRMRLKDTLRCPNFQVFHFGIIFANAHCHRGGLGPSSTRVCGSLRRKPCRNLCDCGEFFYYIYIRSTIYHYKNTI